MKRRLLIAVPIVLILAGLAVVWWYSPVFELPAPDGPNRVGVRAFELVDDSRRGVRGVPAGEPRRLPLRVWYPAAADAKGRTRPYLQLFEAIAIGRNLARGPHFFAYLSRIDTHSVVDAPIERASGAWPVVLYNHGFWCYPEQNTAMFEQLASHGYVVVSIGHPGDSIEARFADGTVVKPHSVRDEQRDAAITASAAAYTGGTTGDERMTALKRFAVDSMAHRIGESALIWRDDNLFVFEALRTARVPDEIREIVAAADFSKVAVTGMSFGGSTAPSVCEVLPECKAAVNLDGESFDFSLYNAELRAPLLMLQTGQPFNEAQFSDPGVNPNDYAYERWAHAGRRSDIVRLRVATLRHLGLLDPLLSARRPWNDETYGTIDGRRGTALYSEAVLQFLDQYVRGKQDVDFPRAFLVKYPEAVLHDASHVRRWWLKRNVALGCSEESIRAWMPANDRKAMRLGNWIEASVGC
jgi:predicted dienelactone hydrolase